jgi:hypothetical protein
MGYHGIPEGINDAIGGSIPAIDSIITTGIYDPRPYNFLSAYVNSISNIEIGPLDIVLAQIQTIIDSWPPAIALV